MAKKNEKMEIIVNGQAFEVANKELGKNLKNILNEMAKMHKSSWGYAKAYHNIIKNSLWSDDFKKQKDFADFMGITNGAISQLVGGVDFIKEHENFTEENISVTNAYLMKTVSIKDDDGKKVNVTEAFISWLSANGHEVNAGTTSKTLKGWIKEYKDSLEAIDVDATEEEITEENADVQGENGYTYQPADYDLFFTIHIAKDKEEVGLENQYHIMEKNTVWKKDEGVSHEYKEQLVGMEALAEYLQNMADAVKKAVDEKKKATETK